MGKVENRSGRIKILFLHSVNCLGGAEFSFVSLVTNLDRERFAPMVVIPPDGPLTAEFAKNDVPVRHLPMKRLQRPRGVGQVLLTLLACRESARGLRHLINEERPCVVHANNATAALHAALAVGKGAARTPLIWHERDIRGRGAVGRFIAGRCAGIIAISQSVEESLRGFIGDNEKIVVLPNGIDADRFAVDENNAASRGSLGLPEDAPIILMAGQMVPWKKHDVFLRAAALIKDEFPEVCFAIAGSDMFDDHPDYVAGLRELRDELGLGRRVSFIGFIEDMPSLLFQSRCVVLPSVNEPFGRIVLEAMAARRPVVAVAAAGPAEIIDDGRDGLLAPPDDPAALAEAIRQILTDQSKADELAKAGFDKVRNMYNVEKMVSGFEKIVADVIGVDGDQSVRSD